MAIKGLPQKRKQGGSEAADRLAEGPFLDELRAVERLLPIAPGEISQRVLGSQLDEAALNAAERLNEMNLRHYETVIRPLVNEWVREVHTRRLLQVGVFLASCTALSLGCYQDGLAGPVLCFVGAFGFLTAVANWFGSASAAFGERLVAKLGRLAQRTRGDRA